MNALMPLVEQFVVNSLVSKQAPFMRKSKLGLGLIALSGLFFCAALVFLIIAGYGWLLTQFTQPEAALITAGFIMATSILTALSAILVLRKAPQQAINTQSDEIHEMVTMIGELLGEELETSIRENPKTAMILAGAAGLIAADRLH